jgi:hypothetical protein
MGLVKGPKTNGDGYAEEVVKLAEQHGVTLCLETGRLDASLSFEDLRRRSHINAAAQAADKAPDFSRRIRADLPSIGGAAGAARAPPP